MPLRALATSRKVYEAHSDPPEFVRCRTLVPKMISSGFAQDSERGLSTCSSWTTERFFSLLIDEVPRLRDDVKGYGPNGKGFIAHVDVPEYVERAWQRMREVLTTRQPLIHAVDYPCNVLQPLVLKHLRYMIPDLVTWLRRLQEVLWHISGQLACLCPLPDVIVISTCMLGVEVNEGLRAGPIACLPPNLAKDSNVDRTHQLLSDDVHTMCCRNRSARRHRCCHHPLSHQTYRHAFGRCGLHS